MVKHPRKRQKTTSEDPGLAALLDDASKDDEERRLESMLFGTKFVPGTSANDAEIEPEVVGGREMQNLLDTDLFFVDDGEPSSISELTLESNDDDASENEEDEEDNSASDGETPAPPPSRKPAAWLDPSDPTSVSLSSKRLRKLRDAPSETSLQGREYESRLRRQFERINPEPQWASQARKASKRRSSTSTDEDEDAELDVKDLLSSTSGILASSKHRSSRSATVLSTGTLAIERLRDANQSAQASGSGGIKSLAFHPSDIVPVLCVGTADRRVRLYNIDGHTSPLLQTLHVPTLPLTSQSSVSFHPSGSHLLLTGPRPYYFVYDLQSGTMTNMGGKNGLWGTRFDDPTTSVTSGRKRGRSKGADAPSEGDGVGMEVSAFSSGGGDMLAIGGRGGNVHLVDWKSGAGQVVGSLKCAGGGGGVKALWWTGEGGASSREHLAVLTGESEVYLWDVGERRCVRKWKDSGGYRGAGRVMAGSGKGKGWLAVGSNTGLVNVYGSDSYASPSQDAIVTQPKPVKTLESLTTAISTLRFNHDAQLLAVASREKKDSMKLIHLPSLTSFSNWPTSSTPLGHVSAIDFSAQSEYVALGNTRGRVLLYHLRDFGVSY